MATTINADTGSVSSSADQHSIVVPGSTPKMTTDVPAFTFPALSQPLSPQSPRSPGRRRPKSPIRIHRDDVSSDDGRNHAALPSFSFNPGASLPPNPLESPMLSPPTSPLSGNPQSSASRPPRHGHRRGGSEFVGGSIRDGNSIAVFSTSPTKESGFGPSLQLPPPRRGHRRGVSGTISTNDLPILPPPLTSWMPKGNSAPNSPTNFDQGIHATIPILDDATSIPALADSVDQSRNASAEASESELAEETARPKNTKSTTRARVGFSDTLEFIPRPLSLVSTDTSSTVTVRPTHSVSGSISSLVSPTSPASRDTASPPPRSTTRSLDSRPSTAGAILDRAASAPDAVNTSPRRRNSIPALIGMAQAQQNRSSADQTKPSKRWSFFGLDSFSSSHTSKPRPSSSSSSDSELPSDAESDLDAVDRSKSKKRNRRSKVKKGVKDWAGAILPLKHKHDKKRARPDLVRPATPPAPAMTLDDDAEDEQAVLRERPIPTIVTPSSTEPYRLPREDITSPMIDLDAALGPFNTPLPHNPEWEAAQRAAGNVGKRRLHSAQGLKGFSGPGMHYHRRAESAPDLPPFEAGRGIHRFGSSSTMADVFEEDEEDDGAAAKDKFDSDPERSPTLASLGSGGMLGGAESSQRHVRRTGSSLSDKDQAARSVRTERSRTSLHESIIMEEPQWNSAASTRSPSLVQQGRNSFDSSAPSPKKLSGMFDPAEVRASPSTSPNVPSVSMMPLSPYSTSHASSHPSPRSPMSIDAQRISTAPSSVADESCFQSLLMGEPGPEVRISMDYDIPSLTSSTSTMTRESAFIPTARPYQAALREQRPASMSSAAFGRRRSSLISLSRLISSSHGERSKLSTELTPDTQAEARSPKRHRKTRLSKMMQFWKPGKEDANRTA